MGTEIDVRDTIQSVVVDTIWDHSIFSMALARVQFHPVTIPNPLSIDTMAVDPKGNIYYCADFVRKLKKSELQFVILHEVLHLLFMHGSRQRQRIHLLWNIACDKALNQLLVDLGFTPPEEFPPLLPDSAQRTWSAERLYEEILESCISAPAPDGPIAPGQGCGLLGDEGAEGDQTGSDIEWLAVTEQMLVEAKGKGDSAGSRLMEFFDLPPTKVKYSNILRTSICQPNNRRTHNKVSSWNRLSRRCHGTRFILPGNISTSVSVAVLIDTSGSVGDESIKQAIADTKTIAKESNTKIFLVTHDAEVQFAGWVNESIPKESIKGRGGTLFQPAYDAVRETKRKFDFVVHLTDGMPCDEWPSLPPNVGKGIVALIGYKERSSIPSSWRIVDAEV